MLITTREVVPRYAFRAELFAQQLDVESLVRKYLSREPHCFLHIGELRRALESIQRNDLQVVSIGTDIIKDIFISDLIVRMHVVDGDAEFVASANVYAARVGLSDKISFHELWITEATINSLLKAHHPNVLQLLQMDYVLDDQLIRAIVEAAHAQEVEYIVVMSPSILTFQINHNPIALLSSTFQWLERFYALCMKNIRGRRIKTADETLETYTRSATHFMSMFNTRYRCCYHNIYQFPSGEANLMVFKKN